MLRRNGIFQTGPLPKLPASCPFGAVAPFSGMSAPATLAGSGRPVLRSLSRRQGILFAAALAGGALGALFAGEIVQAATGVWSAYVVPAFFELLLSGIPFCA